MDLFIVTMITYGRLSLSGVVGDHPGETIIRKGRSMNIQLMNVAVDIIEQRLAPLANVLTRNNHITAMRDSFALAMPFVIVGSLLVPILFPPVSIDGASRFGQVYLLLRPILLPTFQLTIGLVALIVAFGASASLAKQYRLPERLCGLTGCLAFLLFIGFRETAVSNVYLGGMGIFTALISSAYSIEIIRFFYKKGWCIRLPDEVPLMTRNGFQLLIPLLVVMLSISVMNAIMLQTTGRIVPELISEAVRPLVLASDTLMAVLISLFICNLLWFIGIHGALIITGIMNPFWMTYLFENQQALAAGSPTLPHIYLQGFWDFYLLIGGIGHAGDHRFQGSHLQPLFENKPAGEIARDGAADRHVVGGTADGQLADIAAGKEQRVNYIAVGGEGEAIPLSGKRRQIEARLILLLRQPGVGESLHKQVADQLLHCLTAATVG